MRRPPEWQYLILAACALLADRLTKFAVERWSVPGFEHVLVPGMLNLIHTNNPGVAFGLFADSGSPWLSPLLILFSASVIVFLVWLLTTGRAGGNAGKTGMALILGGAAGNLLDRVVRHSVTDFIDFHIGTHHWYTFNIADSVIVAGSLLVLFELLKDWKQAAEEKA